MPTTPRLYQREGASAIERFGGRALLADSMGLGKSLQFLLYAQRNPHLRPAIIVCPASLKYNWQIEASKHFGILTDVLEGTRPPKKGLTNHHPILIINYDILRFWLHWLKRLGPKLVCLDECFVYETQVLTDYGLLSIGDIVENQLPVSVASFDFNQNTIVFKRILHYYKNQRDTRLIKVFHSGGSFVCTENHEIWTKNRNFVQAVSLTCGDYLQTLRQQIPRLQPSELEKGLLREKMQQCLQLPKNERVANRSTQTGFIEADERKKPDVDARHKRKSTEDKRRTGVSSYLEGRTWGQWQNNQAGENLAKSSWGWLGITSPNSYRILPWSERISQLLQSGRWQQRPDDCHRNRRGRAQGEEIQRTGREEANLPRISRVESVEILERRNRRESDGSFAEDQFVYCLEVEDNHNFYADGVLVSNCHYASNEAAKRSKAAEALCKEATSVVGLSGTPLTNRPAELWFPMKIIKPDLFPDWWAFANEFIGPKLRHWGWDFSGAKNTDTLHQLLLGRVMIRRTKEEVLKELPAKQRVVLPLPIEDRKQYQKAETDFIAWLSEKSLSKAKRAAKAEKLAQLGHLRRLAGKLKLKYAVEWIDDFLQENDGKLVCFAVHKAVIKQLAKRYGKQCVVVDGSVTGRDRQRAVEKFQTDSKTRVFIGNIVAAGVGITLTAAATVAFLELPWQPGAVMQAEDRCHRIGQAGQVMVYFLIAKDTLESKLCDMIQRKSKVIDSVLDGGETSNINIHNQLLDSYWKETKE